MTRTTLQRVLPVVASVAILVWLLEGIDFGALADALSWRVAGLMTVAMLAYGAVALWLEVVTITRLLQDEEATLSHWNAARIKSASYLLGMVNYALGVAALSLLLHRRASVPLGRAAGLVILVSSADLIVVLLLAGMSAAVMQTGPGLHAGVLLVGLVGFFGGLLLLRMPGSLGPLEKLRQLPIFDGLRTITPRRLAELFALRLIFSACFVSVCASSFYAFDVRVPMLELVSGVLIVALVGAVPIGVAGLGTTQAAFLYLYSEYASQETLLAMSLVLTAGMLLLRAAMGMVFAREYTREALESARTAPT
ncbi:MAG: lysylphosphatidylglycerol synthase domain-containing protein [Deltaproteobacteria bacterium]|nr:lysylphosphatidylglycerol synthase domain-containing protein [Deltaproteobacteria bacterium]